MTSVCNYIIALVHTDRLHSIGYSRIQFINLVNMLGLIIRGV